MSKNKLTIDEQIEHMKNKGIMFNIVDEKSAKEFLTYNNYYFKIKSFVEHKEYYKYNNCITSYYKFVKIIVDFFYESCI